LQEKLALATPPLPVKALVEPLSEQELEKLETAAEKTENGQIRDAQVVPEKFLTAHDFSTLLPTMFNGDPKAWLNDNIVNEYLGVLVADLKKKAGFEHKRGGPAPTVHAFSSFWYPTITDKKFPGVSRWAARFQLAGKQYLDADLLLYPICDGGHWRLLVVKPKERTIEYLDSLGWDGSKYIDKLKEYLGLELKEAWIEDEWTVLSKQRSTRQVNCSDCGVFAILNALALLRGEEFIKVLACDGMLDARERIATTLMAGVPTTEFD
jgi:Ulp1 family protease